MAMFEDLGMAAPRHAVNQRVEDAYAVAVFGG